MSFSGSTHIENTSMIEQLAGSVFRNTRLLMLIILLILVAGLSSLALLPRMEDPVLTPRSALVITQLPGADAERVESLITEKIENQLRDVPEISEITSDSRVGISTISIELADNIYDTPPVWSNIRGKIEDAIPDLPPEATRPVFDELNIRAYSMIIGLVWTRSDQADHRVLRRLATDLQDQLQAISGTEVVDRFGDPGEEIEVIVDAQQAASLGLSADRVAQRIAAYDAKGTAGQMQSPLITLPLEVGNQLDAVDSLKSIPIASRNGKDVRLDEVARIGLSTPDPLPRASLLNGRDAVVLGAMVRTDTRIDAWTSRAESFLNEYAKSLPYGVEIDRILVQNEYVEQRLDDLGSNLLFGAAAVAIVIFFMMGWRSSIVVTLALPLTSLVVLFVMRVIGMPIHQMSVTGLIIAFGLLIDNAIVVVDDVKGRLRDGLAPAAAMTLSVHHLAIPLLGSTLTTAFAFAPIALTPGSGGEFIGGIAISVIIAIFASLALAVTVIPSVAARFVKAQPTASQESGRTTRFGRFLDTGVTLGPLTKVYESAIRECVKRPIVGILIGLTLPISGFMAASTLREQFFPPTDRNQFHIQIDLPITASINHTRATATSIETIIREYNVERVDWFFGDSAPEFYYNVMSDRRRQPSHAHAIVTLPLGSDPIPVIQQLQTQLEQSFLEPRILVRQVEQGPPFEAPVEVQLFGPDLNVLRELGQDIRRRVNNHPEVVAVRTDLSEVLPQVSLAVDETTALSTGITPEQISNRLAATLSGTPGGSVIQDNEEIPVRVRVSNEKRGNLANIQTLEIPLPNSTGDRYQMIPVAALGRIDLKPESAAIPRLDRQRMNEVSIYIRAGVLPSVVQSALEQSLTNDPLNLPAGYGIKFGGEAGERDDAVANLLSTVGLLGTLMVATLVLSFNSFRMAALIGLVGALSTGLALLALAIGQYPFGFVAIVGTMGLVGVAINDSIVVLAGIRANPLARAGNVDAAVDEAMHATRHVVATTLTTTAGFSPLIVSGGDFWAPLAVAISGGVLGASLLALALVPAAHQWLVRPKKAVHKSVINRVVEFVSSFFWSTQPNTNVSRSRP